MNPATNLRAKRSTIYVAECENGAARASAGRTRRTLVGLSRFDETPDELVIELTPDGYRTVGNKADAKQADRAVTLRDELPTDPPGLTAEEILCAWPENDVPKPGLRTTRADLKKLDGVLVSGSGTKGNAKRYSIPASSPSIGAGMESNANGVEYQRSQLTYKES